MSQEEWKSITSFNRAISISNLGRIKNSDNNKIFCTSFDKYGYERLFIKDCGHGRNIYIHREVAIAFILNPDKKDQVNHEDAIKKNNNSSNLTWMSSQENTAHAKNLGLMKKGQDNPSSKLTSLQVEEIRSIYNKTPKVGKHRKKGFLKQLATKYGVSKTQIERILNKLVWA